MTQSDLCALLWYLHLFLPLPPLPVCLFPLTRLRGRLPFWNWLSIRMCWSCMMFTRITNTCEFCLHSSEPQKWGHCRLHAFFLSLLPNTELWSGDGYKYYCRNYIHLLSSLLFSRLPSCHTIIPTKDFWSFLRKNIYPKMFERCYKTAAGVDEQAGRQRIHEKIDKLRSQHCDPRIQHPDLITVIEEWLFYSFYYILSSCLREMNVSAHTVVPRWRRQVPGVGACVGGRAVWLPGEEGPADSERGPEVLQADHLCFGFLPQSFHLVGFVGIKRWFLNCDLGHM